MPIDFSKHKKGDVVRVHCCDSCARAAGIQPKCPPDSGSRSWPCEVCGHWGIGSATDCTIGDWLILHPNKRLTAETSNARVAQQSPAEAQPVATLVNRKDADGGKTTTFIRPTGLGLDLPIGEYPLHLHPPPSAPVGVDYAKRLATSLWQRHYREDAPQWEPCEDLMGLLSQIDNMVSGLTRAAQQPAADPRSTHRVWRGDDWQPCYCEATNDHRIGSEQPAAADGVKCPWDGGSPCVEPMPARMVYPKKPTPRAGGYLDTSGVEWNAWDAGQMEAYARAAYSDGWEAGCREALAAQQQGGRDHE